MYEPYFVWISIVSLLNIMRTDHSFVPENQSVIFFFYFIFLKKKRVLKKGEVKIVKIDFS